LSALLLCRSAVEKIVSSHGIVITDINIVEGEREIGSNLFLNDFGG
jgi:hypothetical protein